MGKELQENGKNDLIKKSGKNALHLLAARLNVSPDVLQQTLMSTVFKECKKKEDFISAIVVANTYKLNPILKEIYAYPNKKGDGITPVVSTDGWTKLMTSHPEYSTHYFTYSDEIVTMPKAKPCPEWCEIHILKNNGKEVIIREYLDEVFRDLTFTNPWQTHTKRMLRHKTKIQGAREGFGFAGIYDEDEAERIDESQLIGLKNNKQPTKPQITMPQSKSEQKKEKAKEEELMKNNVNTETGEVIDNNEFIDDENIQF